MSTPAAKILVVEDERLTLVEVRSRLNILGYDVVATACSGQEAVSLARQLNPSLVLMDVNLGEGLDGIGAAEAIADQGQDIPVIFMTADVTEETLARAAGSAHGYLVKPFGNQDLRVAVEVALMRHEMRQKLLESEERYRTIFENASVGIFRLDSTGRTLLRVNHAMASMLGYTDPAEMQALIRDAGIQIFAEEDDLQRLLSVVADFGKLDSVEVQLVGRDGDLLWASLGIRSISFGGKQYLDGTVVDVTRRKEAEEAYTASFALLKQTIQAIADPLAVTDINGYIILANAAMAQEFCADEEDLKAARYQDITGLGIGALPSAAEASLVTSKRGRIGRYLESVTPFLDPAGNIIGTVRVLRMTPGTFKLRGTSCKPTVITTPIS